MCFLRTLFVVAMLAILAAAQRDVPEREARTAGIAQDEKTPNGAPAERKAGPAVQSTRRR
jgi:hypothetical protein